MGSFESHTNYNKQTNSVMLKLFFWKFYITSVLPIASHSEFLFSVIRGTGTSYDDFTTSWYLKRGAGIIFGNFIFNFLGSYSRVAVLIGLTLSDYYKPRLMRAWDRGFRDQRKHKKTLSKLRTHREYIELHKNSHFQIDRSYAELLNIIFFTCTFWIMLPHIFLPNMFFLIVLYFRDKILSIPTT